jgi:hypothetical protein
MIVILIVFNMINKNKALNFESISWHQMGERAHMSFRIHPGSPDQNFKLDVWLPTGEGKPSQVSVRLKELKETASEMVLPMTYLNGGADPYGFEGFDKYTYSAKETLFKMYGEWRVNIQITDAEDQVFNYEKEILISKR